MASHLWDEIENGGMVLINVLKLKGKIAEAGHSQTSLAEAACMSKNTLNAKVNGRTPFNCDEADLICSLLGIASNDEKAEIFLPTSSQKWDDIK